MIKLKGSGGNPSGGGKTILSALEDAQVFAIYRRGAQFIIQEGCDSYFDVVLTRARLLQLADEIRALAESAA